MRIGLVLSKPPAYSETFFVSKIKGLQAEGFEVELFVQKGVKDFNICKVHIAPSYSKGMLWVFMTGLIGVFKLLINFKRSRQFIQYKKDDGLSLINALKHLLYNTHILGRDLDWLHFGFSTIALGREQLAKSIDAKMGVSCRGYDMDVYLLKHPSAYTILWKYVDKVHCISEYMSKRVKLYSNNPKVPISIIYPAIWELKNEKTHSTNHIFKDVVKITTIARLHWIKGIIETLEAMSILTEDFDAFEYNIIGTGDEYDNVKYAIHQLGLERRVKLLGQMSHIDVQKELESTNIYVQYSHSEGFCNSVLEAQVHGCFCVVSDGGALPENIISNRTGLVVPKRQPKLLAESLLRAINMDDDERKSFIEASRERIKERFLLEQQMSLFKKFYEE